MGANFKLIEKYCISDVLQSKLQKTTSDERVTVLRVSKHTWSVTMRKKLDCEDLNHSEILYKNNL